MLYLSSFKHSVLAFLVGAGAVQAGAAPAASAASSSPLEEVQKTLKNLLSSLGEEGTRLDSAINDEEAGCAAFDKKLGSFLSSEKSALQKIEVEIKAEQE
jgi:hypothetical protein